MRVWRTATQVLVAAAALAASSAGAGTIIEPRLKLITEERYDTSLLRPADPAADGRTLVPRDELMTKVTPEVGLTLQQRTLDASAFYAPDLQMRHLSGTVGVDHRGGFDFEHRLSRRHSVFANGRLWRVEDPTSLPPNLVGRASGDLTSPVLYGTADAGLRAQLAERWSSVFRYRFEGTRISNDHTRSGQVHAPTAEGWYRLTPRTSLGAEYRFQYFVDTEHAVAHSPAAALRHRLSRQWTVSLRGGPVWFSHLTGSGNGVAPRLHAELSHGGRHLEVGLQAGQDVTGASGFSSAQWAQYGGLYAAWHVLLPLRLYAGAYGFRNGDAPGELDEYLGQDGHAQNGYAVGGGVEWQIDRMFALQGQLDRISQVGPGSESRNIAAVRLVVTPW